MKKLLKLTLAFFMVLALVGCGKEEPKVDETSKNDEDVVVKVIRTNPFTGAEDMSDKGYGKRPIAVSVNNVSASLPQYGISTADLIYEFELRWCVYE